MVLQKCEKTLGQEAKRDPFLEQFLLPPRLGDPVINRFYHRTATRDAPLGAERRESTGSAL
jgi:hypothetical protein